MRYKILILILLFIICAVYALAASDTANQAPDTEKQKNTNENYEKIIEKYFKRMYHPSGLGSITSFKYLKRGGIKIDQGTADALKEYRKANYSGRLSDSFKGAYYRMGYWDPYLKEIFRKHLKDTGLSQKEIDILPYMIGIVESFWNRGRRSHMGAVGYWQIMARTGKLDLGMNTGQYEGEDFNRDDRLDPLLGGDACARYLMKNYLISKCIILAKSLYNGRQAIDKKNYENYIKYINSYINGLLNDIRARDSYPYYNSKRETLNGITSKFSISLSELVKINKLIGVDPKLPLGRNMKLIIPSKTHETKKRLFYDQFETRGYLENFAFYPRLLAVKELIEEGFVTEQAKPVTIRETEKLILENSFICHIVKKGEYVSKIAKKYGVNYKSVLKINNLKEKSIIRPGQILKITPDNKKAITLRMLAKKHGLSLKEMQFLNQSVKDPDLPLSGIFVYRY